MQRNTLVVVLGCRICTVLKKELSNFHGRCPMQWGPLVFVLARRICAALEKESDDFHIRDPCLFLKSCYDGLYGAAGFELLREGMVD
jgi:hypothetical protein